MISGPPNLSQFLYSLPISRITPVADMEALYWPISKDASLT